jgi:cell division protein FtsQ
MKKILSIIVWILSTAGILILYGFARESFQSSDIKDLQIRIDRAQPNGFLSYNSLRTAINKASDSVIGKQVKQVDVARLSAMIDQNPWVSGNEVCIGLDGVLRIKVDERKAIIRVYSYGNKSLYLDEAGYLFPENINYTPRVRIASGYISLPASKNRAKGHVLDSLYSQSILNELLKIEMALRDNEFLDALIDQIYVNSIGEYELVPKLGKAVVILGNTEMLNHKLAKLVQYYKSSAFKPEMLDYRSINLKFRNQIVCTKI